MKIMANYVIIIAGGTGSRMGQDVPKQFLNVYDRPIILYTLEKFQNHPLVEGIVCVCLPEWKAMLQAYAKQYGISKLEQVVDGGKSRYESIKNGIEAIQCINDSDVVIVHDSVRPAVTTEVITSVIEECEVHGASMAIIPAVDSMYAVDGDGFTSKNIDRDTMVRGQTPEAFTYERAKAMYAMSEETGIVNDSITALQILQGKKVAFAKGSEKNLKLTTVDDIEIFKALLKSEKLDWQR